jgi:putative flippase GtrA
VHRSPGLLGRLRATWRVLLKEIGAFGVVGGFSFVVDLALFQLLYAHVGLGAVTAKVASTLVSTTVAYVGHRYWSFSHRAQLGPRRSFLLFTVINGGTLLLGAGIVAFVRYPLGQDSVLVIQLANIASIVLGSVLRWLTYRWWVFPAHPAPDAVTAGGAAAGASTQRSAA